MIRSIGAVIAGVIGWGILFHVFGLGLMAIRSGTFTEDGGTTDSLNLVILLVLSVVVSIAMGFLTGTIAKTNPMKHVMVLGTINLIIGIVVQAMQWDMLPVWYHIPFLVFVLPATLAGGRLVKSR